MSVFQYTALNKDGKSLNGTMTAPSRAEVIAQMLRQGLHPVSIDESVDKAASRQDHGTDASGVPAKVSHSAVEAFTRELANLLAGGVPLSRSLSLLRREAANPAARQLWGKIHDDVVGGTALADALAKYPRNFSTVYVAMVRAGEAGGFLDVVLAQISDFRTRERDLKGKVKAAMVYPCILAILAVCVMAGLLTFFIPRFKSIFAAFGSDLPLLTRAIIAFSNLVTTRYAGFLVLGVFVAIYVIRRAVTTETGRRKMEVAVLAIPLLGRISARFALVRFARMLGTLAGAGVPLIASLRVAREALGNQTLADTVSNGIEQVQRGVALSQALVGNVKLFPPSVVEMLAVAEETGRLDKELIRLAQSYEMDLDRELRLLVAVVEPLMLFVMAAIIGTIVVGMLLPILEMQELVH